jgi:hypothetical protein
MRLADRIKTGQGLQGGVEARRADQAGNMLGIARIILREMTESDIGTTPIE